jgi:hypothetical protein
MKTFKTTLATALSNRNIARVGLLISLLPLSALADSIAYTYSYSGPPLSVLNGGPSGTTSISGWFETSAPLPANNTTSFSWVTDAQTAGYWYCAGYGGGDDCLLDSVQIQLLGFSFTDGEATITLPEVSVPGGQNNAIDFQLWTDSLGNITTSQILIYTNKYAGSTTAREFWTNPGGDSSWGFANGNFSGDNYSAQNAVGTWSPGTASETSTPEPGTIGLTMSSAIALLAIRRRRLS